MNKTIIKQVENPYVYTLLQKYKIKNTPNIINVDNNIIEYEYIEGVDLAQYQETHQIDYNLCLHITLSLINILENLKIYNIVHKDIKPQNIIINDKKEVFLIDFNASRYESDKKAKDTILMGTEGYASPEHYGYFATTYRSDIYSLGKTLEEICNNRFVEFNQIIKKMIQFDPANRYQDYKELRKDLKKYVIKNKKNIKNYKKVKDKKYYNLKLFNVNYPLSITQIFITLFFLIIMFTSSINNPDVYNSPKDLITNIFVYWIFIDFIDYIKLTFYLVKDFSKNKCFIWRRILFSTIIFIVLLIIDIIYSSLF